MPKWMDKPVDHTRDPAPYDGPIARADGRRPFNMYLYPTEWWWAYDEFGHRGFSGRFHFGIIALNDGRWATEGSVSQIEANSDNPHGMWKKPGRPVVFDTREKAVRIAAARFLRLCRWARTWDGPDHLTEENCRKAVNWALSIAKRPAIEFSPIPPPIPPAPKPTGLPILDYLASL
jgi:hypothetical protein